MKKNKLRGRGVTSSTTEGRKPVIAVRLQERAKSLMLQKLEILQNILALHDASSGVLLEQGLPTSRRAFLAWQPNGTDGIVLGRNANDTLVKYADIAKTVDDLVLVIKKASSVKKACSSKEERLAASRRSQNLHKMIRMIAEKALVKARNDVEIKRQEVILLKAKLEASEREFKIIIDELTQECINLRAENSRIITLIKKSIPIRSIR